MRDCNSCVHHKQGQHPPPSCQACLSLPHLPLWEPMTKVEQAQKQHDAYMHGAPAFVEMDPTSQPGSGTMIPGGVLLAAQEPLKKYDTKLTNPKDLIGSSKLPMHLWPETATAMGALGLLDGMLKYGRSNWREAGVRASIYADAAKRHINAWFEGEDADPDSGLPHMAHALACLAIIVDAGFADKLNDDRMYPGGYRKAITALTPHVDRLKKQHADKNPKHYTIEDKA